MSANTSDSSQAEVAVPKMAVVPKKITNAQTVCNERSEKGKLCNGHLKQLNTGGEDARVHLRGDDVLFKCNICGTLYMGPPLGHLRDPGKMNRFVERELTALLQAAGGSLPAFARNAAGALVQVSPAPEGHGHAAPSAKAAPAAPAAAPVEETAEQKRVRKLAEAAARKATVVPIPGASGPPPGGETPEQKIARLKAVAAEAKRRKESGESGVALEAAAPVAAAPAAVAAPKPAVKTAPAVGKAASPIPGASGPIPGETPEQKLARLKAVVAEAKRRKEAGETGESAAAEEVVATAPELAASTPEVKVSAPAPKPVPSVPSGPVEGETKEQKMARLQAVVAEAKRRKEAGEGPAPSAPVAAAPASVAPAPPVEAVATPSPTVETKVAKPLGPVPGETKEEKIARLKAQVEAAKLKAGK